MGEPGTGYTAYTTQCRRFSKTCYMWKKKKKKSHI